MFSTLIRIGNSRGIRLPKTLIEEAGLTDELEIEVVDGAVVIRPAHEPRRGWAEAAEACAREDNDLDDWDTTTSDFDGAWQ